MPIGVKLEPLQPVVPSWFFLANTYNLDPPEIRYQSDL